MKLTHLRNPNVLLALAALPLCGLALLWARRSPEPLPAPAPASALHAHDGPVLGLAFAPDGAHLATCGDRAVHMLHVATRSRVRTFAERPNLVDAIAFAPDGRTLAAGCRDGTVTLWDADSGAERTVLQPHAGPVWTLAFAPDGHTLAAGSGDFHAVPERSGALTLWDLATGSATVRHGHRQAVVSLAFAPDGRTLASGGLADRDVLLWDVAEGCERSRFEAQAYGFVRVGWSPDGKWLAATSQGDDDTVTVWKPDGSRRWASFGFHPPGLRALAFAPDSRLLAVGCLFEGRHTASGEIRLYHAAQGHERGQFRVPERRVRCLAFSPDGSLLVAGCEDGCVLFWHVTDLPTGT